MNISEYPDAVAAMHLRDPVANRRLSYAVNIVPCCCKVNEETVEKIQFVVKDKFREAPANTPCPVCKETMQGVYVDHWTRKMVEQFYKSVATAGSELKVPPESPILWKGPILEYPKGPSGIFTMDKPYPQAISEGKSFYRSDLRDSPLQAICFTFNQYERYFEFNFKENCGFEDFLASRGIYLDDHDRHEHYVYFDKPEQMRQMFELFVQHNGFAPADLARIREELNNTTVSMPRRLDFN